MSVTIVKEDRLVVVDGESINFNFDLEDYIWAVQWNGTVGEIEFSDGTPNQEITDFTRFQYLVDGFNSEKQRLADEATQAEVDRIANMTYADKRREEYPPIEDQLDDMYHNGIAGWHATIQAIKAKYPKE